MNGLTKPKINESVLVSPSNDSLFSGEFIGRIVATPETNAEVREGHYLVVDQDDDFFEVERSQISRGLEEIMAELD